MSPTRSTAIVLIGCLLWWRFHSNVAEAEVVTYSIVEAESSIRVVPTTFKPPPDFGIESGTSFLDRYGIYEQSPGSLESKVTGTLTAKVSGSTLTFSGGNTIDVLPHPNAPFLPDVPTSPGVEYNFGAYVRFSFTEPPERDGEAAVLDAVADLVGGSATLDGPVTGLQFGLTSGILDYRLDFPAQLDHIDLAPLTAIVHNESPHMLSGDVNGTIHIPFYLEFPYGIVEPNDSMLVLEGELMASRAAPTLPGDYNDNGAVDAADYVLWRKLSGTSDARADGDNDGTVGPGDYAVWRTNFGRTPGAAASAGHLASAVPEPASIMLVAMSMFVVMMRRRRV